ncbi:MAG: trypsin-like peptidase domain-containing protein [Oscillospiraceae bacterium]|jgi:serine protease Do|nr:trypsin-like peptidase domain-containing protein [Oscillospiraceae bacterium]
MNNGGFDRFPYQVERPADTAPASPETPGARKKHPALTLVSLFLAFTLVIGGTGGLVGYYISQSGGQQEQPAGEPEPPLLSVSPDASAEPPQRTDPPLVSQAAVSLDGALSIQEIFARGDKSTVAVSTMSNGTNIFGQPVSQAAAGSGFILTADGYILTNHHVVEDASDVTVMLYDGAEYPAEIVGSDPITDIAVLKIDAAGLSPVRLGDSDRMVVGDMVVAIGNPLGELANSLTAGYISAKKRIVSIDNIPRVMLQTDASVSPGNSGGPLFNVFGEVIGVVSAKTVADGVEGIGFAIPVNIAVSIANELIQNGAIKGRPLLGIEYQEISSLQDGKDYPKGIYIAKVTAGSAAAKAGLKPGDVITVFNGEPVKEGAELLIALNMCRVGQTVPVTVWRNGTEISLSVVLDTEKTDDLSQPQQQQRPSFPWGR